MHGFTSCIHNNYSWRNRHNLHTGISGWHKHQSYNSYRNIANCHNHWEPILANHHFWICSCKWLWLYAIYKALCIGSWFQNTYRHFKRDHNYYSYNCCKLDNNMIINACTALQNPFLFFIIIIIIIILLVTRKLAKCLLSYDETLQTLGLNVEHACSHRFEISFFSS